MYITPPPSTPTIPVHSPLLFVSAIHFVTLGLINIRNTFFYQGIKRNIIVRKKILNIVYVHRSTPSLYLIIYMTCIILINAIKVGYTYELETLRNCAVFDQFQNSNNRRNVNEIVQILK